MMFWGIRDCESFWSWGRVRGFGAEVEKIVLKDGLRDLEIN